MLLLIVAGCSRDFAPPDATVEVTNSNDYIVWPVSLSSSGSLVEALRGRGRANYKFLRPGQTIELRLTFLGGRSEDGGCNSSDTLFVRSRSGRTNYWIARADDGLVVAPTAEEIETDFEVIDSWPRETTCWPSRSNEYQLPTVE